MNIMFKSSFASTRLGVFTIATTLASMPFAKAQGRLIAFSQRQFASGNVNWRDDIYTVSADGRKRKRLTTNGTSTQPSWTPDGKKIVYLVNGNQADLPGQIWIMNNDGTYKRKLTHSSYWYCDTPSVSPDGMKILFQGSSRRGVPAPNALEALRVVDISGSKIRSIASIENNQPSFCFPVFSHDGSSIYYVDSGEEPGTSSLYKLTVRSRRKQILYGRGKNSRFYDVGQMAVSPDGKKLVVSTGGFVDTRSKEFETQGKRGPAGLVVMDSNGSHAQQVLVDRLKNSDPITGASWSSDGHHLLFANSYAILALDIRTKRKQVILRGENMDHPVWQPGSMPR